VGEITQRPVGFFNVIKLPGEAERLAVRTMRYLGQTIDHVARLVNLTPPDLYMPAEGPANGLAQRPGAINYEQPAYLGIDPVLDQIVDEGLNKGGVLGRLSEQTERMSIAFFVDPERGNQHQPVPACAAVRIGNGTPL
jgi:hypothetical protein